MSIKVTKGDITIEVDTENELKVVIDTLEKTRKRGVSINPKDCVTDVDTLIEVYKGIPSYSMASKVLNLLREKPDGRTTQELVKGLGLDNEQALGGVLGSIGRYAKEFGVNTGDIYQWAFIDNKGVYRLTKDMAEAINTTTNQEGE